MRHLLWKRILFLSLSILCVLSSASLGSTAPCGVLSFPEDSDSPYLSLADALTLGRGCKKDSEMAHVWYQEAYEMGRLKR